MRNNSVVSSRTKVIFQFLDVWEKMVKDVKAVRQNLVEQG